MLPVVPGNDACCLAINRLTRLRFWQGFSQYTWQHQAAALEMKRTTSPSAIPSLGLVSTQVSPPWGPLCISGLAESLPGSGLWLTQLCWQERQLPTLPWADCETSVPHCICLGLHFSSWRLNPWPFNLCSMALGVLEVLESSKVVSKHLQVAASEHFFWGNNS